MNPALERHREQFEADPTGAQAFEALEEHYFLEGAWQELAALYRRRLGAADLDAKPAVRGRLLQRLGQVLEERLARADEALACYEEAARLAPSFQPTLRRLRALYLERAQWELALQVGELEARTPMRPRERAAFQAELAEIWLERVGDASHALGLCERALEDDPGCASALRGCARCLEALGQAEEAASMWERLAAQAPRGERSAARLALARLCQGPLADPERALRLYREALAEDPDDPDLVEAAAAAATAAGGREEALALAERRFALAAGARRRAAVARETAEGLLQDDPVSARLWLERARNLEPEDPRIHLALAEAAGRSGDAAGRAESLERAAVLDAGCLPVAALVELGSQQAARGEHARAAELLRAALEREPGRPEILDALAAAHRAAGSHAELVDLLEERAALGAAGPGARAAALAQLGDLHERHLGDPEAAADAYRRAFEANPSTPGVALALERLYRKAEAWDALERVLEAARSVAPPAERVPLLCSLGELRAEHGDDAGAAREAYEEALALDPQCARAFHGLERLAAKSGDEDALLAAFAREMQEGADPARSAFLAWELVRRHEARGELAVAVHWADHLARKAPDDRDALETCVRLHESLGHDAELVAAIERLDPLLAGAARAALGRRLAVVHRRHAREDAATEALLAAVEADPDDVEALRGLVEPLRRAGRLRELARVHRSLAGTLPPPERAVQLGELATLLADELDDPDAAVVVLWRLVEDPDAPPGVDARLERVLERTRRFGELAQRLAERRLALAPDDPEAVELDLRRARVLRAHLAQFAQAAPLYRAVYERLGRGDPRSASALDGFEACARGEGDDEELAWVLGERASQAREPGERARLLLERARLLDERLERGAEAEGLYAELAEAGGEVAGEANERLVRALERRGDWPRLHERLEAALAAAPDDAALDLRERLAQLCLDRLDDPQGATEHLEAASRLRPERARTWALLASLYETADRPREARAALEAELALGGGERDPGREVALRTRAARLCREALGDADAARAHLERVLELAPGHTEAVSFLAEHYERAGRVPELVALLEARVAALEAGARPDPGRAASLRVRIAELQAQILCDTGAAIATLEPAVGTDAAADDGLGRAALAATPLAELYTREGRWGELAALARRMADASRDAGARADWCARLGAALRAGGQARSAIAAYQDALGARPGDDAAQDALRHLYRETGEWESLARLLEARLPGLGGADETGARLELAGILAERLERPADALLHLRRVLEIDPLHAEARERALALAESLALADALLELLDGALAHTHAADRRAALLLRRGALLAGPLGRIPDAVAAYREAAALEPRDPGARRALRDALERAGDWSAFLDELQTAAREAGGAERLALLERGVEIAAQRLSEDASLPWLERLRSERSDDPDVVARIAEVHRRAGRHEALLRALEAELALRRDGGRRRRIQLELARILEGALGSPARAVAVLERAWREDPGDREVLAELDRLHAAAGRPRQRAEALERRIEASPESERGPLHRAAAELYLERLGEPGRAALHLARALDLDGGPRVALLQALGRALRAARRVGEWVEVAEAELAALDPGQAVFDERRRELHRELASAYQRECADPEAALAHLRALVDAPEPEPDDELAVDERDRAEEALLDALRAEGAHAELEARLAGHLARRTRDADAWLELGRLREERLHLPERAAQAYAAAAEREPSNLAALRGLRRVAERRGDWSEVARGLELEIEVRADAPAPERAALLRALGDVAWQRLQSTTRASRAYAAALEAAPSDLGVLRALQGLSETMEDWRGAADLYAREIELVDEGEPGRRRALHLRVAELARDRLSDPERAIAALEAAEGLGPLDPPWRRSLAVLHQRRGDRARYVELFAAWCDDPAAGAAGSDHLALARALEELERPAEALARVDRGLRLEPRGAELWAAAGRLREALGDVEGAAQALAEAAGRASDAPAARHLLHAAALVEEAHPARALAWLREASRRDPAAPGVHAARARLAERCGEAAEAENAASCTLDLAAGDARLEPDLLLASALIGARAAHGRGDLEAAARFASSARALDPGSGEALALEGRVLFEMGEIQGARRALEARLAVAGERRYPERAQHAALLGAALEAAGEADAALARFREALELDPAAETARAGELRIHERAGRLREALAARLAWAGHAGPEERARQLARAAELELACGADEETAEAHLREALDADPASPEACLLLTTRLAESGRGDEALELSSQALERASDGDVRARLAALRARLLELRGERRAAADAYAVAAEADRGDVRSALARARILRALGEWEDAAASLAHFAEGFPAGDATLLAQVHFQRGRLLAGPLERVEEGLDGYRAALAANPRFRDAHAALASLLVHRPECWDEALARHRSLLEIAPHDAEFLRGALRIAEGRGKAAAAVQGRVILAALGAAAPAERAGAPARLDLAVGKGVSLENAVWERARRMVCAVSEEIGRALGASPQAALGVAADDPRTAFRTQALAAEARLAAPALIPLETDELGEVLRLVAALGTDSEQVHGDGRRVNAFASELGRRARRRVRRELEGIDPREVAEIDFEAWRRELRGLAHAQALDAIGGELRPALLALVEAERAGTGWDPGPEADLGPALAASPAAEALLRRVVRAWLEQI